MAIFATPAQARPSVPRIDSEVRAAMARTGARGLALAVVDRGEPVLVRAWGHRNAAGDPLETDTIMYGASLTKAVFAYTVMQLVEEGRLDLDRPLAAYLPRPLPDYGNLEDYGNWGDLAGDERWRKVTARHVLTHSVGWANFSWFEPDGKLRFHFEPGGRYAYSGEGIILLQFAIEKGLGLDLGAEMKRRVFDRFAMARTSMTWRPDFAGNLADGWKSDGSAEPHDERGRVRAAGSMDTTIADLARFAAGFMHGEGLKPRTRAEMLRGQLPIRTASQFPSLGAGGGGRQAMARPGRRARRGGVHRPAGARLLQGRPQRQHRQHVGMPRARPPLRRPALERRQGGGSLPGAGRIDPGRDGAAVALGI
jgi:CubicO group peptidase (beta-lactamase class C family)